MQAIKAQISCKFSKNVSFKACEAHEHTAHETQTKNKSKMCLTTDLVERIVFLNDTVQPVNTNHPATNALYKFCHKDIIKTL